MIEINPSIEVEFNLAQNGKRVCVRPASDTPSLPLPPFSPWPALALPAWRAALALGCCRVCTVENDIAVNAKGPLSNCLLLIMMMRVPSSSRERKLDGEGEREERVARLHANLPEFGVFNVIYCTMPVLGLE